MRIFRISARCAALFLLFSVGCGENKNSSSSTSNTRTKPNSSQIVSRQNNSLSDAWHEVSAENGKFQLKMPGLPVQSKRTAKGSHGPLEFLLHKFQSRGQSFNWILITYPAASIEANGGGFVFLKKLTLSTMRQKKGNRQEFLNRLEDVSVPALEHKYRLPKTKDINGVQIAAGYSSQRLYLVGNQVCWLIAEAFGTNAESNNHRVEDEIEGFFDSLAIAGSSHTPR